MAYTPKPGGAVDFALITEQAFSPPAAATLAPEFEDLPEYQQAFSRTAVGEFSNAATASTSFATQAASEFGQFVNAVARAPSLFMVFRAPAPAKAGSLEFVFTLGTWHTYEPFTNTAALAVGPVVAEATQSIAEFTQSTSVTVQPRQAVAVQAIAPISGANAFFLLATVYVQYGSELAFTQTGTFYRSRLAEAVQPIEPFTNSGPAFGNLKIGGKLLGENTPWLFTNDGPWNVICGLNNLEGDAQTFLALHMDGHDFVDKSRFKHVATLTGSVHIIGEGQVYPQGPAIAGGPNAYATDYNLPPNGTLIPLWKVLSGVRSMATKSLSFASYNGVKFSDAVIDWDTDWTVEVVCKPRSAQYSGGSVWTVSTLAGSNLTLFRDQLSGGYFISHRQPVTLVYRQGTSIPLASNFSEVAGQPFDLVTVTRSGANIWLSVNDKTVLAHSDVTGIVGGTDNRFSLFREVSDYSGWTGTIGYVRVHIGINLYPEIKALMRPAPTAPVPMLVNPSWVFVNGMGLGVAQALTLPDFTNTAEVLSDAPDEQFVSSAIEIPAFLVDHTLRVVNNVAVANQQMVEYSSSTAYRSYTVLSGSISISHLKNQSLRNTSTPLAAPTTINGSALQNYERVFNNVVVYNLLCRFPSGTTPKAPDTIFIGDKQMTLIRSVNLTSANSNHSQWAWTDDLLPTNTTLAVVLYWAAEQVNAAHGQVYSLGQVVSHANGAQMFARGTHKNFETGGSGYRTFAMDEPYGSISNIGMFVGYMDSTTLSTAYMAFQNEPPGSHATEYQASYQTTTYNLGAMMGRWYSQPMGVDIYANNWSTHGASYWEVNHATVTPCLAESSQSIGECINTSQVLVNDGLGRLMLSDYQIPMLDSFWALFSAPVTVNTTKEFGLFVNSSPINGAAQDVLLPGMTTTATALAINNAVANKTFGTSPRTFYFSGDWFENWVGLHNNEAVPTPPVAPYLDRLAYQGPWTGTAYTSTPTVLLARFNDLTPEFSYDGTAVADGGVPMEILEGFGRFKPKSLGRTTSGRNKVTYTTNSDSGGYTTHDVTEIRFWFYVEAPGQEIWVRGWSQTSVFFPITQFNLFHNASTDGHLGVRVSHGVALDSPGWASSTTNRPDGFKSKGLVNYGEWNYVELQHVYRQEGATLWLNGVRDLRLLLDLSYYYTSIFNSPSLVDSEYASAFEHVSVSVDNPGSQTVAIDELSITRVNQAQSYTENLDPTGYYGDLGKPFPVSRALTRYLFLDTHALPEHPFVHPWGSDGLHIPAFGQTAEAVTGAISAQFSANQTLAQVTQIAVVSTDNTSDVFGAQTLDPFTQVAEAVNEAGAAYAESFKALLMPTQVATLTRLVSATQAVSIGLITQTATALRSTGYDQLKVLGSPAQTAAGTVTVTAVQAQTLAVFTQNATAISDQPPVRSVVQSIAVGPPIQTATAVGKLSAQATQALAITQVATLMTFRAAEQSTELGPVVQYVPLFLPVKAVSTYTLLPYVVSQTAVVGGLPSVFVVADQVVPTFTQTALVAGRVSAVQSVALPVYGQGQAKARDTATASQVIPEFSQTATGGWYWPDRTVVQDAQLPAMTSSQQALALVRALVNHQVEEFTVVDQQVTSLVQALAGQLLSPPEQVAILGGPRTKGFVVRVLRETTNRPTPYGKYKGKTVKIKKDPQAVLDYSFNWADWLGQDVIVHVDWTVSGGITITQEAFSATVATAWVSGGDEGKLAELTCKITTANTPPRVDERTLFLDIIQR